MQNLIANFSGQVRRVVENGRRFVVAPLSLLVPGVLAGSKGPLFYPEDEVRNSVSIWDGVPMVINHPSDPVTGQPLSAQHPGVWEKSGIGVVRKPAFNDGKLRAEGWFDEELCRKHNPSILDAVSNGRAVELSTGVYTSNDGKPGVCPYSGRPFTETARDYRSDHLAILPDQTGACSLRDGCGVHNSSVLALDASLNAFCATGEGGGRDNSCSSSGSDGSEIGPEHLTNLGGKRIAFHAGENKGMAGVVTGQIPKRYTKEETTYLIQIDGFPKPGGWSGQTTATHKTLMKMAKLVNNVDLYASLDLAMNEDDGRWVTMGGRPVFIGEDGDIEKGPKALKEWAEQGKGQGKPDKDTKKKVDEKDPLSDIKTVAKGLGKAAKVAGKVAKGLFKGTQAAVGVVLSMGESTHGMPAGLSETRSSKQRGSSADQLRGDFALRRLNNNFDSSLDVSVASLTVNCDCQKCKDKPDEPCQGRCEKGKFQVKGYKGKGRGEVQAAAREGNSQVNNQTFDRSLDGLTLNQGEAMTREQMIQNLTTNCSCYKGEKGAILNSMTEEQLTDLVKKEIVVNAVREGFGDITINAMPAALKAAQERRKSIQEPEEVEEEEEEPAMNRQQVPTVNLSAEDRAALDYGKRRMIEDKVQVVRKLVANVADEGKRKVIANKYMTKDIDELNEMLSLLPTVNVQVGANVPDYFGAAGGNFDFAAPVANMSNDGEKFAMPLNAGSTASK